MKARIRPICFALVASVLASSLSGFSRQAASAHTSLPSDPREIETLIGQAHLTEALTRTTPTSVAEDIALARAITAYESRSIPDDVDALTSYVAEHPNSGWSTAVLTNLGHTYLHFGYFSRAIDAWRRAWNLGKEANEPQAKALVDGAVAELARLYASLGKMDDVAALFREIDNRPITGSATEAVQTARDILTLSEKDPRHLFNCGPTALKALATSLGATPEQVDFLQWYRARPGGTSLEELGQLADRAKFPFKLVFRKPGQPLPTAAIVHWKVGHFAAIVGEKAGRFHVVDGVVPGRSMWVTSAAFDSEASGYYLVPASAPAADWRSVDNREASYIWGKGPTSGTAAGDAGDPGANGGGPGDGGDGGGGWGAGGAGGGGAGGGGNGGGPGGGAGGGGSGGDGGGDGGGGGGGGGGGDNGDDGGGGCSSSSPMCRYNIKESAVSLTLVDTPVGYAPQIGPSAKTIITYNQREDSQPQNFNFFNVSAKWTLNWITYVTDDPTNIGANVSRYLSGGGAYYYSGYDNSTGQFAAQNVDGSILTLVSQNPVQYRRLLSDGRIEIYAQSDGAAGYPRRVFLSQLLDPQGNALTLGYDSQRRLVSLTDATGRQTTFTYGFQFAPLRITKIMDPFGRSAALGYDASGRLASITDIIGLTSSFTYDSNSLVNSMTTPYGTTNFAFSAPGSSAPPRFLQVTDPLGYNEREEWLEPAPIPDSDPAATVPQGMPTAIVNQYLEYRNSFHWDKNAYVFAGCTPSGGCDYTKARVRHFTHATNTSLKSTNIESVKQPFENRVWFSYPGQSNGASIGAFYKPTAIGRVLDDGSTQLTQYSYNTAAFFKLTQKIDPLGRVTRFSYAPNQIDLLAIGQKSGKAAYTAIAQFTYNDKHRPLVYTDAAGQTTFYTYNNFGQVTSVTNPLNQTKNYQYDALGNLITIVNANGAIQASYTYDDYARVRTYTDSEGWKATYDYDAADRVTRITYPDGTSRSYAYDKLDLAFFRDREGRQWAYTHDANQRLTKVVDPLGNQTLLGYNGVNALTNLTDPNGNVTSWSYDARGRLISKQYADSSTVSYAYETTTSRLKSVTDALGQVKQYSYTKDNRLAGVSYSNTVHATPNVSFTYDSYYPRVVTMTDGTGTTNYDYVGGYSFGALRLKQECFIPTGASSCAFQIDYGYDPLSRRNSRTVSGSGPETFQFDTIGRLTGHASDLGSFTLAYLGQTGQIAQRQLASPGSNLSTTWSYLPNSGDRRLTGISNAGLSAGQYSNFQFTTTPEQLVTAITESSDVAPTYPTAQTQTAVYNNLNQLTNLSAQALSYDANGNLLSDGQRTYSWDAENRLIGINYPGQPGKATTFAYDGRGRRSVIVSTPTGGANSTTATYVWCGSRICQARSSGSAQRAYYDEGELVLPSPSQTYFYGVDQLGSIRRVFVSTTNAPAYNFDPYGAPLQAGSPLTDFTYGEMFNNAESGLLLTRRRAYDPQIGRWLSRDPLGESTDSAKNLYRYVGGNPVGAVDPNGLETVVVINNNSSSIPFAGTHAGVITGSGDNTTIYDPGGHYRANAGRGSDDTIRGPDVNVQDYINSQRSDGPDVIVHRYDTTPDQEAQILERIDSQGACYPGQCAFCTSGALQGIPPFQNLPTTWTPRGLNNALP